MDYFDHNATTPLDKEVWESMVPYMRDHYANPSSLHTLGEQQRGVIERARGCIADILDVEPTQVIFTSGGTEANNLFFHGVSEGRAAHAVCVSPYEHPCVLEPARALTHKGWTFSELLGHPSGSLSLQDNEAQLSSLRKGDVLSLMVVNNETGAIQPVREMAARVKAGGAYVHADAAQALGKVPFTFRELGVDALTLSAHKCFGPKGIGALVVSKRLDIQPLFLGGGQERGRRSGTESVGLIVGFATAMVRAVAHQSEWVQYVLALRDVLEHGLRVRGARIFADYVDRVANTTYFAFSGIQGDSWVMALNRRQFAVSSGSACSSQHAGASHVLRAMKYGDEWAGNAVRVSFGWQNTLNAVHRFLAAIDECLVEFRGMAGMVAQL